MPSRPNWLPLPPSLMQLVMRWKGYAFYLTLYGVITLFIANNCELAQKRPFFCLIGLTIPLFCLSCGRVLGTILTMCLWAIISAHLYILWQYHKISYDICMAIAGTDEQEARSMLATIPLWVWGSAVLTLAGSAYLTQRHARYRPICAALCAILLTGGVVTALHHPLNRDIAGHYKTAISYDALNNYYINTSYVQASLSTYIKLPGIIGTLTAITSLHHHYTTGSSARAILPIKPHLRADPVLADKTNALERNIILIIGESDLASHHTLYNYPTYDTTPHLHQLAQAGQLCTVKEAHSAANMTHNAVPMMLSFASPLKRTAIIDEKNLIELAKEQHYKTLWLGAQEASSLYGSPYGYLSEFSDIFIRPDRSNIALYSTENKDDALLPLLQNILKTFQHDGQKHFIIIHLIGSHANYSDRRTQADEIALPDAGSYNQAIHHTDRTIYAIIQLSQHMLGNHTLLYSADHGEILTSPDHGGHGIYDGGYDQYKIPLYLEGEHHDLYCTQADSLRSPKGQFSQLMEKYLLLTMMGYHFVPAILHAETQQDVLLHSDGQTYRYDDLPHPGKDSKTP